MAPKQQKKKSRGRQVVASPTNLHLAPLISGIAGYRSGAKWPDASTAPSVAFSTQFNTSAMAIDGKRFMRFFPNRMNAGIYLQPVITGADVSDWGPATNIPEYNTINQTYESIRLVSASIIIMYTGNNFSNGGFVTVTESTTDNFAPATSPLNPADQAPYKSYGRLSEGVVINARYNSVEAQHYQGVAQALQNVGLDAWNNYCVFVEGADTASPQSFEIFVIQNWEGIPKAGSVGALNATPAAKDSQAIRTKVADFLSTSNVAQWGDAAHQARDAMGSAAAAIQYVSGFMAAGAVGAGAHYLKAPRRSLLPQ